MMKHGFINMAQSPFEKFSIKHQSLYRKNSQSPRIKKVRQSKAKINSISWHFLPSEAFKIFLQGQSVISMFYNKILQCLFFQ